MATETLCEAGVCVGLCFGGMKAAELRFSRRGNGDEKLENVKNKDTPSTNINAATLKIFSPIKMANKHTDLIGYGSFGVRHIQCFGRHRFV